MSAKNREVIDMTANENENNELNKLRESNTNLIAERESLMGEVEQLKKKLEDETKSRRRIYDWYEAEKNKVHALTIIIKAIGGNIDACTLADNIEKAL